MARRKHIDDILRKWPYAGEEESVRIVKGDGGRDVLQMRIDLGVLQLETEGRPDGSEPEGAKTYYDYLVLQNLRHGDDEEDRFVMTEEQCDEVDREFVQFYHRRICWLQMGEFGNAAKDADHTLNLMDFCRDHSPDEQWTMSHEQYRPFVLFHRSQAAALSSLDDKGPEDAINELSQGLDQLREIFVQYEAEDHFDEDELVARLIELREKLREDYEIGRTIYEQLSDAVANEKYELAAQLRDKLAKQKSNVRRT